MVPGFLVWRCAGCATPADGKGSNGEFEQIPPMPRALSELVGAVGLYLGRLGSAHVGDKARLERALDRAIVNGRKQFAPEDGKDQPTPATSPGPSIADLKPGRYFLIKYDDGSGKIWYDQLIIESQPVVKSWPAPERKS